MKEPDTTAARLAAVKPARWRGRGELPSLPWTPPTRGPILLIDLWSGFSGAALALLSLGVRIYVLAAESNPEAVALAEASIDQIVHVEMVESVNADMVKKILERRTIECIMVGGGSPCQGNTALNRGRKGLQDPRSLQPTQLARISDELKSSYPHIPVLTFLENVASAPREVEEHYNKLMGVNPLFIDAAIFGWVQRKRLYWAKGPGGEDLSWNGACLPKGFSTSWRQGRTVLNYAGKPIPKSVRLEGGYSWSGENPEKVVANSGTGAMYPFTREFPHPEEPTRAKWDVVERFKADGRRFPVDSYESGNLAWRGKEWRTLTSSERAQIHGFPPAAVKPDGTKNEDREKERVANCAIGNGFHSPSIMVVMILLLQAAKVVAGGPRGLGPAGDEVALRMRIRGTVFDEDFLAGTTGLMSPDDCITQMMLLLDGVGDKEFAKLPWRTTRARLREVGGGVRAAQRFWAHESIHGRRCNELGPIATTAKEKAKGWAYLGMQRAPGTSSRGLDHLLQPGLGREEHMKRAIELPSPYSPGATHDPDVRFAARAMVLFGPHIQGWREEQLKRFHEMKEALRPLTEALRRRMPATVKKVAKDKDPATIAALVVLMRWPDRDLAAEYVVGHNTVGHITTSGVFRPVKNEEITNTALAEGFLGRPAVDFVTALMSRPPRKDAADIERLMEAETAKGYQGGPMTRAQMDAKYGVGGWRPMPLFINEEAGGKQRLIANAKGGGHNAWTSEEETLFVMAVGFAAEAVYTIVDEYIEVFLPPESRAWPLERLLNELPEWLQCGLGCDDMNDAFRQSPVSPDHQGTNVVGYYSPTKKAWRFSEVFGLVYGMRSSVLHFNRFPVLNAAVARRMGGAITGPYVDDFNVADLMAAGGSAQKFNGGVLAAMGGSLGPEKHKPIRSQQVTLGVHVRMDEMLTKGVVEFEPRTATVHKVVDSADLLLARGACTPGEAAKLRGSATWAAGNTFGRAGRLGLRPLKDRQYQGQTESNEMNDDLRVGLEFLKEVLPRMQPRPTRIVGASPPPVVVYSDASWPQNMDLTEAVKMGEPPRLGWVIFVPGERPKGYTMILGKEFVDALLPRKTQIFAAEAIAVLAALVLLPDLFAHKELLWFIDNESAVSSLIRGGSKAEDVGQLAAATHLALIERQCAAWFEWIDSDSNPADGLSRDGLLDQWTIQQGWELLEFGQREMDRVKEYMLQEHVTRVIGRFQKEEEATELYS